MAWIYRLLAATTLCTNGATLTALRAATDRGIAPSATQAPPPLPSAFAVVTSRTTDGLYHLDGTGAGGTVDFIVDTGASVSVLTAADAHRLSATRLRGGGPSSLQTAGGRAVMTWWRIPAIEVAGQRLGSVDVAVVDAGMNRSLLGQDMLARLGDIVIADDRLTIRPATPT